MRRGVIVVVCAFLGALAAIPAGTVSAGFSPAAAPGDEVSDDEPSDDDEPGDPGLDGNAAPLPRQQAQRGPAGGHLLPIPAGCPTPTWPQVVFIGRLVASDTTTARFELQQIRAGRAERFTSEGLIDVRYDIDTKYLSAGNQYLVSAAVDEETGDLFSKINPEEPLFFTQDVVGVGDEEVECPTVDDPVRTLTVTGRSIESGVLTPMSNARSDMLRAIVLPVGAAFGILVGLAALRWVGTGIFRGAWNVTFGRSRRRIDDDLDG